MIRYIDSADGITVDRLDGFFEGWPTPPSRETHLEILRRSYAVVLAVDEHSNDVVGFVTAISDGVLSAYIPLLEVRVSHRGRGIGRELMKRMLERLERFYMVDLATDPDKEAFYSSLGMRPAFAMVLRRYDRQAGAAGDNNDN
jgi:ribosomal protein S18 acetylase RimI-like enzyme